MTKSWWRAYSTFWSPCKPDFKTQNAILTRHSWQWTCDQEVIPEPSISQAGGPTTATTKCFNNEKRDQQIKWAGEWYIRSLDHLIASFNHPEI